MKVVIKEVEKISLKNPVLIEGFPGIGMVGTISASFIVEKLQMKLVGYIASTHFPPIAAIHDYKPVSPARIYASEKYNLIVLFSEFVIPSEVVYLLSEEIIRWAKAKKARAIYSLAGIAVQEPQQTIHGIASTPEIADFLKKNGIELVKEGATQGVSGVLIAECAAQKFPAANVMIQTNLAMDPVGSARLIDKISGMLSFEVETKTLVSEGKNVEEKMKEAMDKMKDMHSKYQQMQNENNTMYG